MALCMMIAALGLLMWKVSKDQDNDLSCWQLIASRGIDGKQYMDSKKIGYMLGAFGGFWAIIKSTYSTTGLAPELFALWLSFLAGIDIITTITKGKQPPQEEK